MTGALRGDSRHWSACPGGAAGCWRNREAEAPARARRRGVWSPRSLTLTLRPSRSSPSFANPGSELSGEARPGGLSKRSFLSPCQTGDAQRVGTGVPPSLTSLLAFRAGPAGVSWEGVTGSPFPASSSAPTPSVWHALRGPGTAGPAPSTMSLQGLLPCFSPVHQPLVSLRVPLSLPRSLIYSISLEHPLSQALCRALRI